MAIEKPKLELARELKGVHSVDPSDEEYKDIIKNARRKLETSMAAAMLRKRAFVQACIRETVASKTDKAKASELVKISPGIIGRLHHTDQKQMGLLKEQCAE